LDGADVVLLSVWLQEEHERLDRFFGRLGFRLPEEGPEVAAWAVACAPWSLGVAAEMEARCPEAPLVTVMNPTDVIAGVVNAGSSIRGVGLCVEVDGLRGALAYYFHVPDACIELTHAGVNHDGWVLDLQVDGRNGYALWRDRWAEIEQDPDYHPGNRGMRPILDLTGHLRSSAYHHWPYQVAQTPEQQACWEARSLRSGQAWRGKRERYVEALDEALRTGNPIVDPPGIHPERSRLNYPYTGLTVGRWTQSVATGLANVLPLQVPNRRVAPPGARGEGVLSNFPAEAIVEVPVRVQGRAVQAMPVGELPEWLGGYTRLLAIQRQLIVAYVLDRRLETLKRALAVLPMFGTVQQLNRFAEALHCEFGAS
jgi:alpha-galactosidase/6-phospho-beta-glucosidase family protein